MPEVAFDRTPLLQAIPDLVLHIDNQRRFVDAHIGELSQPLVPPDQFLGKTIDEVLPGRIGKLIIETFEAVCATQQARVVQYELEQEGRMQRYEARMVPDGRGGALCVVRDITTFIEASAENVRLRAAIDQTDDAVVVTDAEATIVYVNPAFTRVTGYTSAEAVGENPRMLKSGHHDEAFYRELWDRISSGQSWSGTMVNRRKDGSLITEQATISPVRDAMGAIVSYVSVKRDISEQLRLERERCELEERYERSQKMEALGQLAGGIAHDFANMISAIRSNAELMQMTAGLELHEGLRDILAASDHVGDLARQLLTFARKQPSEPQRVELGAVIRGMRSMLRRLLGETIELATELSGACWVFIDPSQLQQVVLNLALNARDAMPRGGELTIAAREGGLGRGQSTKAGAEAYVTLIVEDRGEGMSAEVRERMFDPLFTTKERGRGTGLGLSTVYGIVQQSEGQIEVESEPGRGTTIYVRFPRAEALSDSHEAAKVDSAPARRKLPQGDETVLVAEDDDLVRRTTVSMLSRLGYRVLAAADGAQALAIAREHEGPIELLFTDVVMPGLDGIQLAAAMGALRPETRVLFTSGYAQEKPTGPLLQKPFCAPELAQRVRELLDG